MSNLIKSNFIYFNKSNLKIIDSNSKNGQYTPVVFPKFDEQQIDESEYIDGINPNQIKKLVIPEEELAKEKADQIIAAANEKAIEILNQAVLEAKESKNSIFEEAKTNGYNEGYSAGSTEINKLEEELKNNSLIQQQEYEKQITELEPKIVDLMISLIQKITNIVVEDKKEVILHIVKNALKNADNCKEFLIKVSKDDFVALNNKKDEICLNLKDEVQVEIVEDSGLSQNQCMIETESSIIDCSLDVQYQNLITNMKLLSND